MTTADAPAPDPASSPTSPDALTRLRAVLDVAVDDAEDHLFVNVDDLRETLDELDEHRGDDQPADDLDEIAVGVACAEALDGLDDVGRERVVRYLHERYVECTR